MLNKAPEMHPSSKNRINGEARNIAVAVKWGENHIRMSRGNFLLTFDKCSYFFCDNGTKTTNAHTIGR